MNPRFRAGLPRVMCFTAIIATMAISDGSMGAPPATSVTAVSVLEDKLEQYLIRCGVLMTEEQQKEAWAWQVERNEKKKRIYLSEYTAPTYIANQKTTKAPKFAGSSWERLSTLLVAADGTPVAKQPDIWSYNENPELAIFQQETQLTEVSNYSLKTDCTSLVEGASDTKFEAQGKWAVAEASAAFKLAVRYNQKKLERVSVRAGRMKNPLASLFRKIENGSDLVRGGEFQYAVDYWNFAAGNKPLGKAHLLSEFDGMIIYTESDAIKAKDRSVSLEARASVVLGVATAQNDSRISSNSQSSQQLSQSTFDVWTFESNQNDLPLQRIQEIPNAARIKAAWMKLVTASVHYSGGNQVADINELHGAEVNIKFGPVAERHKKRVGVRVAASQANTSSPADFTVTNLSQQSIDSQFVLLSFKLEPTVLLLNNSSDQDERDVPLRVQLGEPLDGEELSKDVAVRVRINKRPIVFTHGDVEPSPQGQRYDWRLPISELTNSPITNISIEPGKDVSCEEPVLGPYVSSILYGKIMQGHSILLHTKDGIALPGGLASHCTVTLPLLVTTASGAKTYRRSLRTMLDLKRLVAIDLSDIRIKKSEIGSLSKFLILSGTTKVREAVSAIGDSDLSEPFLRILGISFDPLNGEWEIPREHIDSERYKRFLERPTAADTAADTSPGKQSQQINPVVVPGN